MDEQKPPGGEALLDTKEAARLLGLSDRTIEAWVRQRKIPYVKMGRLTKFRPESLREWLAAQEQKPEE